VRRQEKGNCWNGFAAGVSGNLERNSGLLIFTLFDQKGALSLFSIAVELDALTNISVDVSTLGMNVKVW
jgi:hypothetical protein